MKAFCLLGKTNLLIEIYKTESMYFCQWPATYNTRVWISLEQNSAVLQFDSINSKMEFAVGSRSGQVFSSWQSTQNKCGHGFRSWNDVYTFISEKANVLFIWKRKGRQLAPLNFWDKINIYLELAKLHLRFGWTLNEMRENKLNVYCFSIRQIRNKFICCQIQIALLFVRIYN